MLFLTLPCAFTGLGTGTRTLVSALLRLHLSFTSFTAVICLHPVETYFSEVFFVEVCFTALSKKKKKSLIIL